MMTTTTMTTKRLRLWSHAIESRTRYEHRRLGRVVHIVTSEGGHGMFVLLSSFPPSLDSLLGNPRENFSCPCPRAISVRAARFIPREPGCGLPPDERSGTGSPGRERVLAKVVPPRKRRHCRRQLARYRV